MIPSILFLILFIFSAVLPAPAAQAVNQAVVSLSDLVGGGYSDFWNSKHRYRVLKGGRASKKSKTTALYFISKLMKHPQSNLLVIRQTYASLKDSCFSELEWAIHRMGVEKYWKISTSPLEMTYLPTGQKILFRGLDDPLKLTSITVSIGFLCWTWIEEAFQVKRESDFDKIDGSIRGNLPADLWPQHTLTFNPWHDKIWIKRRFFDVSDDSDIFTKTTTWKDNEFLGEHDRRYYEKMEKENPRRYWVEGLGNWGIIEGLIYEKWVIEDFDVDIVRRRSSVLAAFGLDFGYSIDPSAFIA
ncbi:MAG: PBSX family phage terminase large subunit [Methanosarcinales archaeon]|jgi:phage terminase large subunit|nr:PBSX family phage terminase large subunit [Methanosarcinales archaeon]